MRGLGSGIKCRMVKGLVLHYKPEVLFIQESKLKCFDNRVVNAVGGSWLTRGVGVDAEGASGGLLVLWNEDCFSMEDCITNSRCIIVSGVLRSVNKKVVFC